MRTRPDVTIVRLADRPDLIGDMWAMASTWPVFMHHDPMADCYYDNVGSHLSEHVLLALDPAGAIAAKAFTAPFVLPDDGDLPDEGWDHVARSCAQTMLHAAAPNAISAIEVAIRPDLQGLGLSAVMLGAMRDNAARHGFTELLAPVRPNGKADVAQPMDEHAFRVRDDGLPVDPWLRVHVRAGGVIDRVAPRAMVIPGTLEEWRAWTGLPFDGPDAVEVPGALAPVMVDRALGWRSTWNPTSGFATASHEPQAHRPPEPTSPCN